MKRLFIIAIALLTIAASAAFAQQKREMRAAWIATVANIDWPSAKAKGHPALQRKEMIQILDSVKALNLNMVIFQIRPTADALYQSDLEPLSNWLTGKQGEWPKGTDLTYSDNGETKTYDPLTFVCEEAHKRCIDVHVWLNPYRITNGFSTSDLAASHIYNQKRQLFLKYGKQWYFNPGLEETRTWLCRVVSDVVSRYDIDGIHFDDYFYPYRIPGEEFPDDETFRDYPRGFTNKDDWRRDNVNLVIQALHDSIKVLKPWVEFGISPFGVWRNIATDPVRGSKTRAGVQNYDDLYADILLWLENDWIDYVVPQLYWEIGKKVADYEILAHWWAKYSYGRNLYAGQSVSGLGNSKVEAWNRPNEICRQIRLNRTIPEVKGSVFFPVHTLLENKLGLCDSLRTDLYYYPAIQPAVSSCCHAMQPTNLKVTRFTEKGTTLNRLTWEPVPDANYYVVYAFPNGEDPDFDDPRYIVCFAHDPEAILKMDLSEFDICVTSINRFHNESLPAVL